jgi:hypothetical protein
MHVHSSLIFYVIFRDIHFLKVNSIEEEHQREWEYADVQTVSHSRITNNRASG